MTQWITKLQSVLTILEVASVWKVMLIGVEKLK
jgi:hypothetical protein